MQNLSDALLAYCGFETTKIAMKDGVGRIVGRVPQDRTTQWSDGVEKLLRAADSSNGAFSIDISRHYFMKGPKLVYAWRLIVQGDESRGVEAILPRVAVARPPHEGGAPDGSFPIQSSGSRSGNLPNGKGAKPLLGLP